MEIEAFVNMRILLLLCRYHITNDYEFILSQKALENGPESSSATTAVTPSDNPAPPSTPSTPASPG